MRGWWVENCCLCDAVRLRGICVKHRSLCGIWVVAVLCDILLHQRQHVECLPFTTGQPALGTKCSFRVTQQIRVQTGNGPQISWYPPCSPAGARGERLYLKIKHVFIYKHWKCREGKCLGVYAGFVCFVTSVGGGPALQRLRWYRRFRSNTCLPQHMQFGFCWV